MKRAILLMLFILCISQTKAYEGYININQFVENICKYSNDKKINKMQNQENNKQYKLRMQQYKISYSLELHPEYSSSINAVPQPDGTLAFHDIQNISITELSEVENKFI